MENKSDTNHKNYVYLHFSFIIFNFIEKIKRKIYFKKQISSKLLYRTCKTKYYNIYVLYLNDVLYDVWILLLLLLLQKRNIFPFVKNDVAAIYNEIFAN